MSRRSTSSRSERIRRSFVAAAAACAIAVAAGVSVPAGTTGCTTHTCEPSNATFTGGRWTDYTTYETTDWNEDWITYPGNVTLNVIFPPGGASPSRALVGIDSYVGDYKSPSGGPDFQGGKNFVNSAGELTELFFASSTGFFVYNASCALYYARFVAHFAPPGFTIFGGAGATGDAGTVVLNDTWTWDGAQWSSQGTTVDAGPEVGPGPRERASMATLNGVTYMIGGFDGVASYFLDDWSWNGAAWQQAHFTPQAAPAPPWPSARADAALAVAAADRKLVLFGGHDATGDLQDTWTWDGTPQDSWTLETLEGGAAPGPRSGAAAASFNGGVVLFGGSSNGATLADTWFWNGSSWMQLNPAVSPSPRFHSSVAAVPGGVLLFGGDSGGGPLGDTWLWNGTTWTLQATAVAPSARYEAAAGGTSNGAVLFGGSDGVIDFLDTWTWSGGGWTPQDPTLPPPPRHGAAAAGP